MNVKLKVGLFKTMINNRDRNTSYTILAKETMEANMDIPWLQGCGAAEQPPNRVPQAFCTVLKLVALAIFLFLIVLVAFVRTHPNQVLLWH